MRIGKFKFANVVQSLISLRGLPELLHGDEPVPVHVGLLHHPPGDPAQLVGAEKE